jgi:hypothetical protein
MRAARRYTWGLLALWAIGCGAIPKPTTIPPCPADPPCGDDCSNVPFKRTLCATTPYGPARANVVIGNPLSSTNMLYCHGGSYALCFFSGPPDATGTNDDNRALPCVVSPDGTSANCTCQVYTSGPYYVDINSILNLGAWYETVAACGADGSGCANIVNCGQEGAPVPGCLQQTVPPVCKYLENQNRNDPSVSLIPHADLISAFSFKMDGDYQLGTSSCNGLGATYAGCMTAPCFFPPGAPQPPQDGDPIQCECPLFTGDFQVGQFNQAKNCSIPPSNGKSYVWSAANSVPATTGSTGGN